jgi:predicted MFS family arabinose efflux permease
MVAAAVLAAALLAGAASFTLLLTMAAVYGCADGFFGPASAALVPEVVPPGQLAQANALVGGSTSVLRIAAPAGAGLVVAVGGPGSALAVLTATLAVAALCLAMARLPVGRISRPTASLVSQLQAGWAGFVSVRWLWLLTGQWAIFSLVILAPVAVLGPAIARQNLGGAAGWGLISSCLALGALGGQILAGQIRRLVRPAFWIACLVPVMTAQAMALGLAAPLPIVGVASVAAGVAFGFQAVIFPTAMQSSVSPEVLSRVAAIDLLGSEGGQPIGYALAGPVGQAIGAHTVLATAAFSMFAASSAFAFLPALRTAHGGQVAAGGQ